MTSTRYASFLVRLWREDGREASRSTATWHGEVEHIQTRRRWDFTALEELVSLLCRQLEETAPSERE